MKLRTFYTFFILLSMSYVFLASSGGRANSSGDGNTGAPDEGGAVCSTCHNGSAYGDISEILEIRDAGGSLITNYTPGDTYSVTLTLAAATGVPTGYSFQMTTLDFQNNNIGTWQNLGANVQEAAAANVGGRLYVEHRGGTSASNTFTMEWVAPASNTGDITFYYIGNLVDGTGGTNNDLGGSGQSFILAPSTSNCFADAGDIPAAVSICEGEATPDFTADYTAADEDDPNSGMPPMIPPSLNEIRLDQSGADNDEYFELLGVPGTDLSPYTFLVIGDGNATTLSGVIESMVDLTGQQIQANGTFLAGEGNMTIGTPDLIANLNFENGDNVTYILVEGFSGANGDDLDTNDDGVLDVTPWTSVVSGVALIEEANPPTGTEFHYGTDLGLPILGPGGSFVPAHSFVNATGTWQIGDFDPANGTDSAGALNPGQTAPTAPGASLYTYIWLLTDGAPAYNIQSVASGGITAPYGASFSGLAAGTYCVAGLSFEGTLPEFNALGFASGNDIQAAIDAAVICGDLELTGCTPLAVVPPATADAGINQQVCGTATDIMLMATASGAGSWSGGAGAFADATATSTFYTPDVSEMGTTVTLTWTTADPDGAGPCTGASSDVLISFVEIPDAEFAYSAATYCQDEMNPLPVHTTGMDGLYTAVATVGGPALAIDPSSGEIDLAASDPGTYDVTNTVSSCGNLVISAVVDGDLINGQPKVIELYVINDIANLSIYGLGSANNGNGGGSVEFTFPAESATAGDYIYLTGDFAAFEAFFGFPAHFSNGSATSLNGDDAVELFCSGMVTDVFGDVNMDGTGSVWQYNDSWVYRNNDAGPNLGTFDPANWNIPGPQAIMDETNNDTAANPVPVGTYTSSAMGGCPDDAQTVSVTVNASPILVDTMLLICEDPAGSGTAIVNLNDYNDLINGDAGNVFEWYDGDPSGSGTVFTNVTAVALPIMNDLFVVVTTPQNCSAQLEVRYSILPTPDPVISGETEVCGGATATYAAVDNGNTYDWALSSGGTIIQNDGASITIEWGTTDNGPHTITLTETSPEGCAATATLDVLVEAVGVLICNDLIQVSLNEICEAAITPDMVLEGDALYPDDSYVVSIEDADGNILPDNVVATTGSYTLTIEHLCSGNTCWGMMIVEDKLAPAITCPDSPTLDLVCSDVEEVYTPDVTVLEAGVILDTGNPIVTENCTEVVITYSDVLADEDCEDAVITRTFVVTDASGNSSSCTQTISIRKPTIADVVMPGAQVVNCNEFDNVDPQTLHDAGYDGFPVAISYYDTTAINETYCNLGASYYDAPIVDLCGGGYKVLRTWTVFDWCSGESTIHVQIIKVEDTDGPTFTCPVYEDISAVTNNGQCQAGVTIQDILDFNDNCSGIGSVVVLLDGVEYSVGDQLVLSSGSYDFTYHVTDECGNEAAPCTTTLNIIDTTPPVAICDEHTVVSINTDGTAIICWQTFDDGSYDNCSDITIKVKRMDASNNVDFTDCVEFDCSDIGETILIRMRVYDIVSDDAFDDNDEDSRYNECMVEVTVQDKLDPVITCPPNKTLDCQADYSEITELVSNSNGGAPTFYNGQLAGYYPAAYDNCEVTITITDSGVPDNCGEGTITRTWTAEDGGGRIVSCDQLITLFNSEPFTAADISWPADHSINCATGLGTDPENLPAGHNFPEIAEDACDLVAVTYEDQLLEITQDACYKILRHWIVVDWCQYDSDVNPTPGYWEYTQVIKVYDSVAPTILSSCEDIVACNYEIDCGASLVELILEAEDDACAASDDLNYSYTIDAFNDGVSDSGSAFNGDSNDASGNFPIGTHHIYWSVEDNCGNITTCDYTFTVADCKKPTPVLINGLATVVMPSSGSVTLWANDFDAPNSGSFDNCTASENLEFYIRIVTATSPELTTLEEIVALGTGATFTCENLGFTDLEVYVVDEAGNWEVGGTYANIQDTNGTCTNMQLAGDIYTEMDEMVADVNVELTSSNLYVPPFLTGDDGHFTFGVENGANYTITPEKDINHQNGVTTYDLVLISKHILGLQSLNSPYKIIAADANRSGSVTTFDLVQIRRLILNVDDAFANNTSWRFIDADYVFPDPTDPFANGAVLPEIISLNGVAEMMMENDFIGVKIGDVNNSAIPNTLLGIQNRNFAADLVLATKEQSLKAGETYEVAITAKDFNQMLGYQFTLNFDETKLAFSNIKSGKLDVTEANFGMTMLEEGVLTTSWHTSEAVSVRNETPLFTLVFEAKESTLLSEVLSVSSSETLAEAYSTTEGDLGIALVFSKENVTFANNTYVLYQNQPNPFRDYTMIGFELPQGMAATISFRDISGKQLKQITADFAKGYNEVKIDTEALGTSGLIYYELKTKDFVETRKMIVVQ